MRKQIRIYEQALPEATAKTRSDFPQEFDEHSADTQAE
jgi:hypothetical protein